MYYLLRNIVDIREINNVNHEIKMVNSKADLYFWNNESKNNTIDKYSSNNSSKNIDNGDLDFDSNMIQKANHVCY